MPKIAHWKETTTICSPPESGDGAPESKQRKT